MATSVGSGTRLIRWSAWLALGMLTSIGIGFAYGLTKPRARG